MPDQLDMASLMQDFAELDLYNNFAYPEFNAFELPGPFGESIPQQAMIIPDPGTGVPLIFALPLMGFMGRRRNT